MRPPLVEEIVRTVDVGNASGGRKDGSGGQGKDALFTPVPTRLQRSARHVSTGDAAGRVPGKGERR